MLSLDSLAKVILSIRDDVSNKKLQKLAYYVYAWYLTIFGVSIAECGLKHGNTGRYVVSCIVVISVMDGRIYRNIKVLFWQAMKTLSLLRAC